MRRRFTPSAVRPKPSNVAVPGSGTAAPIQPLCAPPPVRWIWAAAKYEPFHISVKRFLAEQVTPAFEAINGRPASDEMVAVEIDPVLTAKLGPERRRDRLAHMHRRTFHTVQYWPIVRFARRTLRAGLHALYPLLARGNGNRPPR